MRVAVLFVLGAVAACGNDASMPMDCTEGEMRECYGGPAGTENVGPCKTGLEICSGGRWPGICVGDIVPRAESCNDFDDNCDGVLDNAPTVGNECTGTNGCTGARACDAGGSIRCFAPSKNECDLCGGPDITNVGDGCTSDEGCVGEFVCSLDKNFAVCTTPTKNECGVCGGPTVTGLTTSCMSADNCPGMMVCNAMGDAAVCDAPVFNECNACFPPVGTPGSTCVGDHGCVGAGACNGTGDALTCTLDAPCGHVMISEISMGSAVCGKDEFVELYNPTSRDVSLAGWALYSRTASSGNINLMVAFAPTATIASHGYFLVGCNGNQAACTGGYTGVAANTVTVDATYSSVDLNVSVGTVYLSTKNNQNPTGVADVTVVDVVGWDDNLNAQPASVFEGTNPTTPITNGSVERKANASSTAITLAAGGSDVTAGNGYDTDDNVSNFVQQAVRVPQNKASGTEP